MFEKCSKHEKQHLGLCDNCATGNCYKGEVKIVSGQISSKSFTSQEEGIGQNYSEFGC